MRGEVVVYPTQRGQPRTARTGHIQSGEAHPAARRVARPQPAEHVVHLGRIAEAEGEAIARHRLDVAGTAADPVVDELPLGETRFEAEHAEAELGHQETQHPVAQQGELADVVVVLPDRHHMRAADQIGHVGQIVER